MFVINLDIHVFPAIFFGLPLLFYFLNSAILGWRLEISYGEALLVMLVMTVILGLVSLAALGGLALYVRQGY